MKATLEYLSRKNQELIATNYKGEDCWWIAVETASKLQDDGIVPHIELVCEFASPYSKTKIFSPKPLKNIVWTSHHVCCTEDLAFDPLIGKPVPKSAYCIVLFGEYIAMRINESDDKTMKDIKNYVREKEEGK